MSPLFAANGAMRRTDRVPRRHDGRRARDRRQPHVSGNARHRRPRRRRRTVVADRRDLQDRRRSPGEATRYLGRIFQAASPRISPYRSRPPGRISTRRADRTWSAPAASRTSRRRSSTACSRTPSMNSSPRSASTSNGAAAARRTSAPIASPPTRRRFISAKASAICPRAWGGHGRSRSPARSATRSQARDATVTVDPDSGDVDTEFNPRVLIWGASLQYSLPYLKSAVVDLGLPDFINRLIPLVEASLQTPVSNVSTSGTVTTGTINPGVIWVGDKFQVGVEAMIPVNRQSGSNVGAIAQLHFFLDDIFPNSIGRPIFGKQAMKATSATEDRHHPRRHPASRRSACARLPRPRQSEGRQHGRHRAARIAAVVHRKTGAGLFHRRSAQCARRGGERQGAGRPAATRTELRVPLKALPPGTYSVSWRVLSVDTHRTQGNFSFRVGP